MSTDPAGPASESPAGQASAPGEPSEDELRAAYEAELSRITPADMMLQAAVSLLNIAARRLGLTGGGDHQQAPDAGAGGDAQAVSERDLEQVRDAIDGVRSLLDVLERSVPQELRPLRDALAQLQIAYAREMAVSTGADHASKQAGPTEANGEPSADEQAPAPGPAQSSGRLWVPGR